MARWIKADGSEEEVQPLDSKRKRFTLSELQKYVGGYIELVQLSKGRTMWVNEEGLIERLPRNHFASQLAGMEIVGDVIVAEGKNGDR